MPMVRERPGAIRSGSSGSTAMYPLGELAALDDVPGRYFPAGSFVDAPVADPVGGAVLQPVEADRAVLGRRVQAHGQAGRSEGDHAGPDRACRDR